MVQQKVLIPIFACICVVNAFHTAHPAGGPARLSFSCSSSPSLVPRFMSTPNENEDFVETENTVSNESQEGVEEDAAAAHQEPEQEGQEEEEDPELTALKDQIAQMEEQLKEKKRKLTYTSDQADEYSQAGYARRVAEMENMRRSRSMMNTSNRSSSTAFQLTKFLPVMEKLAELRAKYGDDEFGKQYNALPGTLMAGFSAMGVAAFAVTQGEPVDKSRMMVVASEHSDNFPTDTVIEPLSDGMELEGNIIRMAECVASLGPVAPEGEETSSEQSEPPSEEAGN